MEGIELIFRSWPEYLAACVLLGFSQLVYVLFGFGAGLIAVGTLLLFLPDIQDVVVLLALACLPSELFIVIKTWRKISWKGAVLISAGVAAGIPVGSWILRFGEPMAVLAALGLFLVVAGSVFLLRAPKQAVQWPTWAGPPVGLTSGLLSGLFGTGGPPLIYYYQLAGVSKAAFRSQLMAVFVLMTIVRMPSYALAGLITVPRLWSALAILPAALLGAWLGHRLHVKLSEETFRKLVSVGLVSIGFVLVARVITGAW